VPQIATLLHNSNKKLVKIANKGQCGFHIISQIPHENKHTGRDSKTYHMPVTLEEHIATVLKSAGGVALDDEHRSEVATGEIWRQRANSNDSVQLPRVLEEWGRENLGYGFMSMETSSSNCQWSPLTNVCHVTEYCVICLSVTFNGIVVRLLALNRV
jgi:hypothetical protein